MNWYLTKDMLGISTMKNRMNPDVAKIVDRRTEEEMIKTAHLIAAAPQLLSALENIISEVGFVEPDGYHEYQLHETDVKQAQAAIDAAKGRD